MDAKGQISLELVLVVGLIFVIVMAIASVVGEDNELNQAMGAARSGAIEGANMNSFAIDNESDFNSFTSSKSRNLGPTSIKIIKIDYNDLGSNNTYNMTNIQLRITASAPSVTNVTDKNALGNLINFYAKKSIYEAFGQMNKTSNPQYFPKNNRYNIVFSRNYYYTNTSVTWI